MSPAARILMGNEAMGRALVECGCELAASYPGTPASEILEAVVAASRELGAGVHAEWSVNEKVAYETALAAAYTGKRAAVSMKQVGLNVASDPFLRSAYLGVKGGMVIIAADDPGPHSSQTEQDSRFFAMFGRVPVLDPSGPREAGEMIGEAFALSEKFEMPVMVRPTTRVCHARQSVPLAAVAAPGRPARFDRDPRRWCATPAHLRELHRELNGKIERLAREGPAPRLTPGDGSQRGRCVVASGAAWAHSWDALDELGLLGKVDLYQVLMPYPLGKNFIINIKNNYEYIIIIEETYPVIELQLGEAKVLGRETKLVPGEGELTPEVIRGVLEKGLGMARPAPPAPSPGKGTPPTLCAGCGHRAAFYAIRETFPGGIFPGDIGCYTLGVNLGAVDTCHCMGAGISQAAGFYHAYARDGGTVPPIVATIGDSTFFHAGIPALINAVIQDARFILVILDNATTAMTGHQPTPELGRTAAGEPAKPVFMTDLALAAGVGFLREADPYDLENFMGLLREADRYCREGEGGPAVIISRHPCVLLREVAAAQARFDVRIGEDCTGCRHCLEAFECPAIIMDEAGERVMIDAGRCIGCGVCVRVCPAGAILAARRGE